MCAHFLGHTIVKVKETPTMRFLLERRVDEEWRSNACIWKRVTDEGFDIKCGEEGI